MKRTGIVIDRRYMDHVMDPGHPESPSGSRPSIRCLKRTKCSIHSNGYPRDQPPERRSKPFIPDVCRACRVNSGKAHTRLDMDTSTCSQSYEVALLAAGGLLELITAVMKGKLDNGFALVRPPGHHAERDQPWDFASSTM